MFIIICTLEQKENNKTLTLANAKKFQNVFCFLTTRQCIWNVINGIFLSKEEKIIKIKRMKMYILILSIDYEKMAQIDAKRPCTD